MTAHSLGLEPILDLGAARRLWDNIVAMRGNPIDLDASGVQRMGGLCLQVLLAAQAAWLRDGLGFRIVEPSESFLEGARMLAADTLISAGDVS